MRGRSSGGIPNDDRFRGRGTRSARCRRSDAPGRIAGRRARLGPATVPPPDPRSARCDGEAVVPPLARTMVPDAVTSRSLPDCTDPQWTGPRRPVRLVYLPPTHWYRCTVAPEQAAGATTDRAGVGERPAATLLALAGLLRARARGPVQPRFEPASTDPPRGRFPAAASPSWRRVTQQGSARQHA